MMNYLVAVDGCFPENPGGMARVAWDLAQLMRDRGHRVTLVSIGDTGAGGDSATRMQDGVRVLSVRKPDLPSWHPGRLGRGVAAVAAATRRHLAEEHWDVVHIHSLQTGTGVLDALGWQGRYVVCTVHSPVVLEQRANAIGQGTVAHLKSLLGSGILRRLEGRALAASSVVHVLSEFTRRELARFHHGVEDRVDVIPHWRRPELRRTMSRREARRRLGWPPHEKILFTVRYHGPRNGLDLAIRALAPLAAGDRCRLYIAGDGPLRRAHEGMAVDLGVADRIVFLGRLPEPDLALAYQAADVFLLPTRALECFGLILVEALSYGCPVLSSDAGAIPEIMDPILPDFVFPAGNVAAMREKVDCFLRGRLALPSEETLTSYVAGRFDAGVLVPRYLTLLEKGASRRAAA